MFNIPPETWLSWVNIARIWGLAITVIASVISLVASIVQSNAQAVVSAKKDEALRIFQTESQERIALANARAAEAEKKAEEARVKAAVAETGQKSLELAAEEARLHQKELGVATEQSRKEQEELRKQNLELPSRVEREPIESLQLQEEMNSYLKDFSSIAREDIFGRWISGTENQMNIENDILRKMEGFYTKGKIGIYTLRDDDDAIVRFREICSAHPRFPFAFYFLALVLKKRGNPEWQQPAREAQRILRITTSFKDHHRAHDGALAKINEMLKDK